MNSAAHEILYVSIMWYVREIYEIYVGIYALKTLINYLNLIIILLFYLQFNIIHCINIQGN